jgi:beta-glucanase (GH16 family)
MQLRPHHPARRKAPRRAAAAPLAAVLAIGLAAGARPAAAAAPLSRSPDGRPLVVTFDEEFDSFRPWRDGRGVWRTTFRDGRSKDPLDVRTLRNNKERQLYVDPGMRLDGRAIGVRPTSALEPFVVHDGVLDIMAQPEPPGVTQALGGYGYTSGLITTQPSFAQAYGYFEMRARLPRGKGVWPAFWLLPADFGWPPELDVMESIGDPGVVYMTAHSKIDKRGADKSRIAPDAFHVFAVAWDPRELVWYVDGREVKRQPTPPDMNRPMYLLANLAVGGSWPGDPDASTPWPARLSIDYIRAYRFAR